MRDEHSTYGWIIEGLVTQASLDLLSAVIALKRKWPRFLSRAPGRGAAGMARPGETMSHLAWLGMAVAAAGVAIASRRTA